MTDWTRPEDDSDLSWMGDGFPHQRTACPCGIYFVFERSDDGTIKQNTIHRALT